MGGLARLRRFQYEWVGGYAEAQGEGEDLEGVGGLVCAEAEGKRGRWRCSPVVVSGGMAICSDRA